MALKWEGLYPLQCVRYFKTRQEKSDLIEAHLLCQHDGNSYCSPRQKWWDIGTNLEIQQLTQFPLRACVQSTVSFPGTTPSASQCWGLINIKQSSSFVCGRTSSRESSGVGKWQLTGLWDFNSGPDFNRFSPQEWFPVVMGDANTPQQPRFSRLSSW